MSYPPPPGPNSPQPYGQQPPQAPGPYGQPPQGVPPQPPAPPQGQPGYGYPQQGPPPQGPPQAPPAQAPGQPGQPGPYGYPPQGPPPQAQQPPYGYPQAPPAPGPYGGGMMMPGGPGGAPEMPGKAKGARILLYAVCIGQLLVSLWNVVDMLRFGYFGSLPPSYYLMLVLWTCAAVVGIVLATRFASGPAGIRMASIILASVMTLGNLYDVVNWFFPNVLISLVLLLTSGAAVAMLAQRETAQWFERPRY